MLLKTEVLDITDLPQPYKTYLYDHVQTDYCLSNNSYFDLYLDDWRENVKAGNMDEYSPKMQEFYTWLEPQTSADRILVKYWW